MANASPGAAPRVQVPGTEAPRLDIEPILTTHRILEVYDRDKRGLTWLHGDLFDSRPQVALSALATAGVLADARSFPYVARLLSSANEDIQCAAARAMGRIAHPGSVKLLLGLAKTARGEKLRREVLEALATAAPQDKEAVTLIRQAARTPVGTAAARSHAAGLLLRLAGGVGLEELLVDSREEILDQALATSILDPTLAPRTVAHCAPLYARLPAHGRATLVALATRQPLPESLGVLRDALADPNAEVRRAAYAAIGTEAHQVPWFSNIVSQLADFVEASPALEDEVHQALQRMGSIPGAGEAVASNVRLKIASRIAELYKQLAATGRKVSSDTHELGWAITRSKEYVEYYFDEDFKAALLRWLKGASSDTTDGLLRRLKATAVRVEVRHFDGYQAVADLIKNPRRTGIALVARELAVAKTGKGRLFWHLIRVIRLAALFLSPSSAAAEAHLLRSIYAWARPEKLFRLAEAAMISLAKVDIPAAEAACKENVALPLASKVLAIASLHLLRELNLPLLEPSATRLLSSQDDPYVTMNAIEAITDGPPSSSGELARALLARLTLGVNREVRDAVAAYLGEKMSLDITESLKEPALSGDDALRAAALSILDQRISAGLVSNRDGTVEFLYRILRGEHEPSRRSAAIMLWKLGDDYAPEVLRDFLITGQDEDTTDMLRRLQGSLRESFVPMLGPLFVRGNVSLQTALRDLLLHSKEPAAGEKALVLALHLRGGSLDEGEESGLEQDAPAALDLRQERTAFQFEREHIQELVMFFSDIQGYSKKAQILTPMQLSTLLQDYEKLLLAHTEAHRGDLVKRMGDGHMFVFQSPLNAVLAAIRLQKSLLRFNRYRDESTRVVIRIGIHSGKVVRKAQGDVLGNAVNIASRLETSARPGSILISDAVQAMVKDAVHAREIGHITVKNISEPIKVFEPYEIVLDLPAELDPLKQARPPGGEASGPDPLDATGHPLDDGAGDNGRGAAAKGLAEIDRCFSLLLSLCRAAENGHVPVAALEEQVLAPWRLLRPRLLGAEGKVE